MLDPLIISNKDARRLFMHKHGLGQPPTGPAKGADLLQLITDLGFVQIDSINTVERAHHMILHARRHSYRPKNLTPLLETDHTLFEHWTHDASVIPTEFLPYWQLKFRRDAVMMRKRWKEWRRAGFEEQFETILDQIRENGPVGSGDVGPGEKRGSGGWWDWHPSKTALEYLWRSGQLSVTSRKSFRKLYDLSERVFQAEHLAKDPGEAATINWACNAALDRLGFANSGEIAAFWDMISAAEARAWCADALKSGAIQEVDITSHDGTLKRSFARPDVQDQLALPAPPKSIRILSPFDPMIRDRKRTERLFGFHYRIEVFVPAPKRQYGYYVFPVLEGETLIGRIDMTCPTSHKCLNVTAFWPEKTVNMGQARVKRLQSAIERSARLAGAATISYAPDWQRC